MNKPSQQLRALSAFCSVLLLLDLVFVAAEDPYRFFDWTVTYGDIYPLGVKQQVVCLLLLVSWFFYVVICSHSHCFWFECVLQLQGILINGQFPGPEIYSVTNDNLIINVRNNLTEPFLLSW